MSRSSIITEAGARRRSVIPREAARSIDHSDVDSGARLAPVLPGEVLRVEFLEPLALSARALAREIGVPPNRVTEILNGTRSITADTAVLLALRFETSPEFWIGLQTAHDLELAVERMRASILRRLQMPGATKAAIAKLRGDLAKVG